MSKVEPKVHFANERTFLSWMHMSVMLGTIGGAMLSLAPSPSDELVHAGSTAETVGRVMIANAVCFCLYALGIFYWRGRKITTGSASSFVDPIGPAVLCVALLGGFIMTLFVHEGGGVALPRACSTAADQALAQCCRSELLLIRHGEKVNDSETGLSPVGMRRAEYLAKCLQDRSPARSLGGIATLIAPTIRPGKSERMVDTLRPTADQLHLEMDQTVDKADPAAFAALIQRSGTMKCNSTTVVSWPHENIPSLVEGLWAGLPWPSSNDAFKAWPSSCPSASWRESVSPQDSECYDQIWQVEFVGLGGALADGVAKPWFPSSMSKLQQGFDGSASSPCSQGLSPL